MSTPIDEGVNFNETGDETHILTGYESGEVNRAISTLSTPASFKQVTIQIKAATDPLAKQLERLSDSIKELQQVPLKRN